MLELVEVRDNFERAFSSKEWGADYERLLHGIQLIFNRFDQILTRNGLEAFAEPGDEFNPEYHDAMLRQPHDTIPPDHVAAVVEKGYKLKGKVIRHAKVAISEGRPDSASEKKGTA